MIDTLNTTFASFVKINYKIDQFDLNSNQIGDVVKIVTHAMISPHTTLIDLYCSMHNLMISLLSVRKMTTTILACVEGVYFPSERDKANESL